MAILTFSEVEKSYGNQAVLRRASFVVEDSARLGVVGANGAGKTTLLRLAAGNELPDAGHVARAAGVRAGMLEQLPDRLEMRTLLDLTRLPTDQAGAIRQALTALENAGLATPERLSRYDALQREFEALGGYEFQHRAPEVLAGLGFSERDWGRAAGSLSGGERTRLSLARLLVFQPELLLLDEPTNHLDEQTTTWLQEFLRAYPGAALIVSHDRTFLDEVVDGVIQLEQGVTRLFRGNYTAYAAKRDQLLKEQEETQRRRLDEIERQEKVVQRFRSHRNFGGMHSRERVLERLRETPTNPSRPARTIRVVAQAGKGSGQEVLSVRGLGCGYGDAFLIRGLDLRLERGDRLCVIGPNGCGKSTLLRCLAGELAPLEGSIEYGFRVQPAYFAQDLGSLDQDATVYETLWNTGVLNERETLQALHRFLFVGPAIEKRVADLSGGEQTRLAFCRLLAHKPNLLFLDEPTNHLDIPSREALEAALLAFEGTLVVVSHDRYLVDRVARKLVVIESGRHRLFDGGYRAYQAELRLAASRVASRRKGAGTSETPSRKRGIPPARLLPRLEREIEGLERQLAEVSAALANPASWSSPSAGAELGEEYARLGRELEAAYQHWSEVAQRVQDAETHA